VPNLFHARGDRFDLDSNHLIRRDLSHLQGARRRFTAITVRLANITNAHWRRAPFLWRFSIAKASQAAAGSHRYARCTRGCQQPLVRIRQKSHGEEIF
jgi:hypothetical protein